MPSRVRRIFQDLARFGALLGWLCGGALLWCAGGALASGHNPLEPIDTSSPRTTLEGFIRAVNEGYESYHMIQAYLASSRLYLSSDEMAMHHMTLNRLAAAERAIDFSGLRPATMHESSRQRTLQLKEILDRIELPPVDAIPDATAMAARPFKLWAIPNTEIRIALVEQGPRAGEYLFTAETANRIPEFFEKVQALPYRSLGSPGVFEFSAYSPAGLALATHRVIPPRWLLEIPAWTQVRWLGEPLWRWVGTCTILLAGMATIAWSFLLSRRWADRKSLAGRWSGLLRPLSLVLVTPALAVIIAEVLRVSGAVGKGLALTLWTVCFVGLTWLVWSCGTTVAESVIRAEKLRTGSIDSQLIRLALRLVTTVLAIAILVEGANRIGLPAYSVLAGLGVGGLAVALAGQQTLANLLGSLIIMFEKPFRIGDWIQVDGIDGRVEDVGFRSTRIRTFYDSVVTIPSSQMVNCTIDNLERRKHREVKTVLNLTYDTPAEKIEDFVESIRQILDRHPKTRKDNLQVGFYDFGPHSLDIWLKFLVKAPNRLAELAERQRILLDILRLAEASGIRFAFPTQTLHLESLPDASPPPAREGERLGAFRAGSKGE